MLFIQRVSAAAESGLIKQGEKCGRPERDSRVMPCVVSALKIFKVINRSGTA